MWLRVLHSIGLTNLSEREVADYESLKYSRGLIGRQGDHGPAVEPGPPAMTKREGEEPSFRINQKVVYPPHGVSVIEKIESAQIEGVEQLHYHLRLLSNNSMVTLAQANLGLAGLRPLGDAREVRALFEILQETNIGIYDIHKDWAGRYRRLLDKMKTGRLTELAEVLKILHLVSQSKSLSFREKKMYERAKYFVVSEVAYVNDISEREAEELVHQALGSSQKRVRRAEAAG